jgi:hypothetical protein
MCEASTNYLHGEPLVLAGYSLLPIWRRSSFAAEFGDAFISDTDLEGGTCADCTQRCPIFSLSYDAYHCLAALATFRDMATCALSSEGPEMEWMRDSPDRDQLFRAIRQVVYDLGATQEFDRRISKLHSLFTSATRTSGEETRKISGERYHVTS